MTSEYQNKGMVKYTSRDYESIMEDFWSMIGTMTELWKPEYGENLWKPQANADPGVILAKFLASCADALGVNLDWLANEMFAPSVTQRKNAEKLFGLIGYVLSWYTAARTEVTFKNIGENPVKLDFGFNGSNFATLNAYNDITGASRVLVYNILPKTNKYGSKETRSRREITTTYVDVFAESDVVTLNPGDSVTRVAIEGELRSASYSVKKIKNSNYTITLPSQHIDTTAIWVRTKTPQGESLKTQWIQCATNAEFITPEPRFAVTYDNYSNAQIQISNYLNQLENYEDNILVIYWIDCSGVIGCVSENVLENLLFAKPTSGDDVFDIDNIAISNLSNTVEMPHTHTVTGKSPETAKEAYYNSRNYINTGDSLCSLPDFQRFLNREPGVDCGVVVDCQKALEYNLSVFNDSELTDEQKAKKYITNRDYPQGDDIFDWGAVLNLDFDPTKQQDLASKMFAVNFKTYTVMCFAVHNDFRPSSYGDGQIYNAEVKNTPQFMRYKPPKQFVSDVIKDYTPLQTMSVDLEFGYARIFKFCVVGKIYTKSSVSEEDAKSIINKVRESLRLYYSPAARNFGVYPTLIEVVEVVKKADDRVSYFDAGSITSNVIHWIDCDPEYFNCISFAKYEDLGNDGKELIIPSECLLK